MRCYCGLGRCFTDSDLIEGGTNGLGHKVAAAYQVNKCLQFAITYFHAFQGLNSGGDDNYKRLQADFKLKI